MSPILVRPVREQLEHDRVIRLLQVKLKRKHEVIANIGEDQSTSVKIGQLQIYPDLVLTTADRGRKLMGTVEVETSESVNHLEARAQWAHLGRARAPFHLYVPAGSVDIARRLATENQVNVSEIWSFHTIGDQTHFRLVHRAPEDKRDRTNRGASSHRRASSTGPSGPSCRVRGAQPAVRTARQRSQARGAKAAARPSPRQACAGKEACRSCPAGEEARRAASAQGERRILVAQRRRSPQARSGTLPEKEVGPAVSAVQSRQAGLREHVRRRKRSPPRAVADAGALLVSHAARREGRTGRARRGGHPADRTAQPRDRVRLDADSQGSGGPTGRVTTAGRRPTTAAGQPPAPPGAGSTRLRGRFSRRSAAER